MTLAADTPRITHPACRIKHLCRTCHYVNENYVDGLQEKHAAGIRVLDHAGLLMDGVNVLPPTASPRIHAYRSLAKLAVRAAAHSPPRFAIGLFKPNTHEIVDLGACPLHVPEINLFLKALRRHLEASALTPYDEEKLTGDLRYVAVRASRHYGELMVVFVTTKPLTAELVPIVKALIADGHKIVAAHMDVNATSGNVIFTGATSQLLGTPQLREYLCDLEFAISPTAFFQINPWVAQILYRRLAHHAGQGRGRNAWDLYCGIGQIGLVLARAGFAVLGVEENAAAIADARQNAARNGLDKNVAFIAGRAEDVLLRLETPAATPDLIAVNPSRRGLAASVRQILAERLTAGRTEKLLYASCSVKTLSRDLAYLVQSGAQLRQIESFDMFPQTDEVEWLAVLENRRANSK